MNKKLLSLLLIMIFMFTSYRGVAEDVDPIEFPVRRLYVDGSYLPVDDLAAERLPDATELSEDIRDQFMSYKNAGDIDSAINLIPVDFTWTANGKKLFKSDAGEIRVTFSLGLNAPTMASASDDMADLPVIPTGDYEHEHDFGFLTLAGDENEQYVNHTKISGTWNYATDYLVASYNVLILEDIKSVGTTNVSIIVSYGNATGASIATAATAYNLTLYNEFLPIARTLWFRLDKEVEIDGNGTDAAILNVEVNGDILNSRRLVSYDADVTDSRYLTTYIGGRSDGDILDLSGDDVRRITPETERHMPSSISSDSFTDEEAAALIAISPDLMSIETDIVTSLVGWDTADALEASIEEALKAREGITTQGWLTDLALDIALWTQSYTSDTVDETRERALDAEETSSDTGDIMDTTYSSTFLKNLLGTGESLLNGLINSTVDHVETAVDTLSAYFTTAADKAVQYSTDITDFITDDVGGIVDGIWNFVSKPFRGLVDAFSWNWELIGLGAVAILILGFVGWMLIKRWMFKSALGR